MVDFTAWDGTIATAVAAHGGRAICTAPAEEANALPSGKTSSTWKGKENQSPTGWWCNNHLEK
jgi:hypothetical protein